MPALRRNVWWIALVCGGCLRGTTADTPSTEPSTTQKVAARVARWSLATNAETDPLAVRLEVRPLESTGAPGSRFLVIATVSDAQGQPRRQKKIEWSLDGVGAISAVDAGSYLTVLEQKSQDKFATSFTAALARTIKGDAGEDVHLQPGQTWCVLTSDIEGDARLTVHCPEIAGGSVRETFVLRRWADIAWTVPQPFAARVGDQADLMTHVLRASDRLPAANYRVRCRIIDGPPALLMPNRAQEVEVAPVNGSARVTVIQPSPRSGRNRIAVELIRGNPSMPETEGTVVARGETMIEWQSAQIALQLTAPPAAVAGQEFPITISMTNPGDMPVAGVAVRVPAPDGADFIRSEPAARDDNGQLIWSLPGIAAGGTQSIQAVFKTPTPGIVQFAAAAQSRDGAIVQKRTTTRVAIAQLQCDIQAPPTAAPGDNTHFDVTITNAGSGRAAHVVMLAQFDEGLEHASRAHPLEVQVGVLEAGQSRSVPLVLTPKQMGMFRVRVTASADGNLTGEALHNLSVAGKVLQVNLTGPATRYAGRTGEWEARIDNAGTVPLTNVMVRVELPRELECRGAGDKGQFTARQAVWNVGLLQAGEQKKFTMTAAALQLTASAQVTAVASADGVADQTSIAPIEVLGVPSVRVQIIPPGPTAAAKSKLLYRVVVRNDGTLAARNVAMTAEFSSATLRPLAATGPTIGRVAGDRVGFEPLDRLDARQSATFLIEVEAVQPGDGRIRVQVKSDPSSQPIETDAAIAIVPPPEKPQGSGSR